MAKRQALYDQFAGPYAAAKRNYVEKYGDPADHFILAYLTAGTLLRTLVDIGCGAGDETSHYETMGFTEVWGVEESTEQLKQARARAVCPERFLLGSFENTCLPDESIDVAVGRYSLHYVVDLNEAFKEIARILRPGGLLLLANRHPYSDIREPKQFVKNGIKYVVPKIYDEVPIPCPLHTLGEYLSPAFLSRFDLIERQVWSRPVEIDPEGSPWLFGMAARRRG